MMMADGSRRLADGLVVTGSSGRAPTSGRVMYTQETGVRDAGS